MYIVPTISYSGSMDYCARYPHWYGSIVNKNQALIILIILKILIVALCLVCFGSVNAQVVPEPGSSSGTSNVVPSKLIRIATGEYPPWIGEHQPGNGYVAQIIRESFKLRGYGVEFIFFPWKRAYEQTNYGHYDATAYWYPSEQRRKDFLYSDPLHYESTHFFFHKSKPLANWQRLEDLKNLKIGVTDGYTYTDEFWALARAGVLNVETANRDELNMGKLIFQRIDIFPIEKQLGFSLLQQNVKPQVSNLIDYHPKPLMETTGHLLFPKSLPASVSRLKDFNQGLAELKKNGHYDLVLNSLFKRN
ncbi:MAG: transporter substrate-binding domain-containing protein [Hahellaceae bacterium]|nr:transporter substrate-binding domain-containing protein [Hahellaceae bacterium]